MRPISFLACLVLLGCSEDPEPEATSCKAHIECEIEDKEVCDLEAGVCKAWPLCFPRTAPGGEQFYCPEGLACIMGGCTYGPASGGEGEGEGEGEAPEGGGEDGPGEAGNDEAGTDEAGEDEGLGDAGPGDEGPEGNEGPDGPPPEPGDICERHAECQGGRLPNLTCKALTDSGVKICTTPCSFSSDCPDLPGLDGEDEPQCCVQLQVRGGGRYCGAAALCLDPTACLVDENCPEGKHCFDRPDLGEDARRCHGSGGLGGACVGILDCNPDLTDRCVYDRDLRRSYCTYGCEYEAEQPGCPSWTCCGDVGFDRDADEFACLNGGADRCDIAGRDCDARDDRHDLVGEPDDEFEGARELPDEGFNGILCPNDEDWTYVDVELGQSIFGFLRWTQPFDQEAPTFELNDSDNRFLARGQEAHCVADPNGETEACTLETEMISPDPGRYYIVVEAEADREVSYALSVRLGCEDNDDCRRFAVGQQRCDALGGGLGVCVDRFPCVVNDDCAGTRICNQADQSCVEICNADRHELDGGANSCGGPAIPDLSQPGKGADLTVCEEDEDWFVIGVPQGDGLEVSLDYRAASGGLTLQISSPDCRNALRVSNPAAEVTRARLEAAPIGGNYYVRVKGATPESQNSYTLNHEIREGGYCVDDEFEDDDFGGDAIRVDGLEVGDDPVEFPARRLCEGDDDWYQITLRAAEVLSIFVDSPVGEAEGNLDVEVYGPNVGGLLLPAIATGENVEAGEELHVQSPGLGSYYIRLHGGIDLEYVLRLERSAPPCDDDIWEPNDQADLSGVLEANSETPFVREALFCGGSDDWWQIFWLRRGGIRIEVCVDDPGEGDLDIVLYRAGEEDREAIGASINVQQECEVIDVARLPEEGDYRLRVFSRERPQVPYTLTVTLTEPCVDPRFEANDDNGNSRELAPGDYPGLRRCDADEDWFHFVKPRDATLWIDLFTAPDAAPLEVLLLNRNGASVLSVGRPDEPGRYAVASTDSFFASNEPRYKLRVFSEVVEDIVDYEMQVVLRPAPADCDDDDPREPVDSSLIRAETVFPDQYDDQRLCTGDRDHWPLVLDAGQTLSAEMRLTHADGDLTLILLAPDGLTELDRSETDGDTEQVTMEEASEAGGRYIVRVIGADSEVDNSYSITLTVE